MALLRSTGTFSPFSCLSVLVHAWPSVLERVGPSITHKRGCHSNQVPRDVTQVKRLSFLPQGDVELVTRLRTVVPHFSCGPVRSLHDLQKLSWVDHVGPKRAQAVST